MGPSGSSKAARPSRRTLLLWGAFMLYALLVIYILTGALPPEPATHEDTDGGGGGGGGGGSQEPLPPKTSPGLSPIYTVRSHVPSFDVVGNIALFIPLGFLGTLSLTRVPIFPRLLGGLLSLMVSMLVSTSCEAYQATLWYRVTEVSDVVWNSTGALVGVILALLLILALFLHGRGHPGGIDR